MNSIQVYSKQFRNGCIIETYYDPKNESTGFLVYENGKVSKQSSYSHKGKTYIPPALT